MKNHLILSIIVGMMYTVLFVATAPIPAGIVIFFLTFVSSIVTIIGVVVVRELAKRMWPVRMRIWEERYGGVVITDDTRVKRVTSKKTDIDYYETIGGKLIKAPQKKHIIRGERGNFADVVKMDKCVFPFMPKFSIDDDGKDGKANLNIIPEDQRTWLANDLEANIKVTTPMQSKWVMVLPILTVITTVGLLIGLFIIAADTYPKYMDEMAKNMKQERASMEKTVDKFSDNLDRIMVSSKEPYVEEEEEPPGF